MQVHLEPAQAVAVPGTALTVSVVVTNETDDARTCEVRVVGLEPAWVEHSAGTLTVPAGSRLEVPIRITLPHGFPQGDQLVGIEVAADGVQPVIAELELSVSDLESLGLGLSPVTVRGGWRGRFRLNLQNRGTEPLTIRLSGRGHGPEETKSELQFQFTPAEVTLRPGERVKTRGTVRGKRHLFGAPRRRALTVTAQGATSPRHVQGAFVQRPLMPKNILRVVGLVLVLAMWAGALTTGVRLTSKSDKATAQDAAAVTDDPAAGGAGGADGGGAAGPGTAGGQPTEAVPVTGAVIAGQVKAAGDPSGVTVTLRPVALADDLGDDIALISSSSDSGKQTAQVLRSVAAVDDVKSTTTDVDGRWAFGGLRSPANYELTFAKAGFASRTYVVTVDDDTPTVALDVDMAAGDGELSGTVRGPDGPLGGVVITVTDGTVTYKTTTPTTGDVGAWSVSGLSTPATYLVTATRRGFGTESTSVNLGSGGTERGIDLTMAPGVGSINGEVTGAGQPLGAALVTATDGKTTRTATTLTEGAVGRFGLPQLPIPGTYSVTVQADGWQTQTLEVKLKGNDSSVKVDLVRTTATIVGTVSGPTGALASTGVTLALDKPIIKTLSAIDPAGTYELTGLAPGTYTLTFERADYKPETTIVTVAAGDRKTVDITMTPQAGAGIPKDATVRGIARSSSTGNPIAGVQVTMNGTTMTTDASGSFVFTQLSPGTYDVKFVHGTYQTTTRNVRVGAKSDTTIDVSMLPLGGVQGIVSDLTATPLTGVLVSVVNASGTPAFSVSAPLTGADGQYALLERIPTGSYVMTFTKAGFQTRTRAVDVVAGTTVTADITLIELGAIHGVVQAPATGVTGGFEAVDGATIDVYAGTTATGSPVQSVTTDTNGEYLVQGLQPGDYTVRASALSTSVDKRINGLKLRETADGSVILVPNPVPMAGQVYYVDANGVRRPVPNASMTAKVVVGFRTLTVFPFIQPDVPTRTVSVDATTGAWSLAQADGPVAGSSGSYAVTAPGFDAKTVTLSAPLVSASAGDIQMVPTVRDVQGVVALENHGPSSTEDVTVTLTGGNLTSPVQTVVNGMSDAPAARGAFSFANIVPGTYQLSFSTAGNTYQPRSNLAFTLNPGVGAATFSTSLSPTTLKKYAKVTVQATDGLGAALGGVSVTMDGTGTKTSDATTGEVVFDQLTEGTKTITFTKAGYATNTTPVSVTLQPGDVKSYADPDASLIGKLFDWPDVIVTVYSDLGGTKTALSSGVTVTGRIAGGATIAAPTAAANVFTFGGLDPSHDYVFTVTPGAGNDPVTLATITAADLLVHALAGTNHPVDADLPEWPKLTVKLRADGNFDGDLADPGDVVVGASGITARISTNVDAAIPLTSNGDGTYSSAAGVRPGTYNLTASVTGYLRTGLPALPTPAITAGSVPTTPVIDFKKLPPLSIHVAKHLLGAGSDVNFTGLAPGAVVARKDGTGTPINLLDPENDGTYTSAAFVAEGTYAYTITAAGFAATTTALDSVVTAGSLPTNDAQTVVMGELPTISVKLLTDTSYTTVGTVYDDPIVDATGIKALIAGGTSPADDIALTDAGHDGTYISSVGVKPGVYTITAAPAGYVLVGTIGTVTISAGAATTPPEISYKKLPPLSIHVAKHLLGAGSNVNFTGLAPGAVVARKDGTGTPINLLDPDDDGTYTSPAFVAAGTYAYTITAAGYAHATGPVDSVVTAGAVPTNDAQTVVMGELPKLTVNLRADNDFDGDWTDVPGDRLLGATGIKALIAGGTSPGDDVALVGNGDGTYSSVTGVAPGVYTITAAPAGYVLVGTIGTVTITAGANTAAPNIDFTVLPRLSMVVQGKLVVGSPVTDTVSAVTTATVVAHPVGVVGTAQDVSLTDPDQDGTYVSTGSVAAGDYDITASDTAHGWAADTDPLFPATKRVTVVAGAAPSVPTVVLLAVKGTIKGKVIGIDGTGLANVTVTFQSGGHIETVQTDGGGTKGQFTSPLLAGVNWTITFQLSTYSPVTLTSVPLGRGATVTTPDVVMLELGATISGKVFGKYASGTPADVLADVDVTVTGSGSAAGVSRTQKTLSGGQYSFGDLPPGSYQLGFSLAGYTTPSLGGGFSINAKAAQILSAPDVTLTAIAGSATVTVTPSDTNTSLSLTGLGLTWTDSPVGSRLLSNPTGTNVDATPTTLAKRTYASMPPGTYSVTVTSTPAGYVYTGGAIPVTVTSGSDAAVPISLQAVGTISGTIQIDDNGTPTNDSGATVSVALSPSSATLVHTGATYSYANVPVGTYTVTFSKSGYASDLHASVSVTRGATATVDGVVSKLGTISGVGTASGNFASGITVTLTKGATVVATTSASAIDGTYTFTNVPIDTGYTITFSKSGLTNDAVLTGIDVTVGATLTGKNGDVT